MSKVKSDIIGKQFGSLVVKSYISPHKRTHLYECLCECGNVATVQRKYLILGDTKSCGCLKGSAFTRLNTKHGMYYTEEYSRWAGMKSRCTTTGDGNYHNYGGQGIEFEFHNFKDFLEEIGSYPKDGKKYTIERIDNSKGYIKGNIKWVTNSAQARNKGALKGNTLESGVTLVKRKDETYALAVWYELDGQRRSKAFSVKKYGIMEATALAVKARRSAIARLNEAGAMYSENHGKTTNTFRVHKENTGE